MRKLLLASAIAAIPMLAMAQNQTQITGPTTPKDPSDPRSPKVALPTKPDQARLPKNTASGSKDPFDVHQNTKQATKPTIAPTLGQ